MGAANPKNMIQHNNCHNMTKPTEMNNEKEETHKKKNIKKKE